MQNAADGRDVAVVLCTRERPAELGQALPALIATAAGAELVVVDSAPRDAVTETLVRAHPGVRYVREERPGLDRARNRAAAETTRTLLAFTDDDARADVAWVRTLAARFARNPDVSAITGLVLPLELETEAQWLFERYLGFGRGMERRWYLAESDGPIARRHGNTGKLGTGANMAVRREALGRVGGFDPALDAGTPAGGAGDLGMFFRVLKAGGLLLYEPAAVVRHRHWRTRAELDAQLVSWGTGMAAYLTSISLAFPEEAAPALALRRWLDRTWFAQRYLRARLGRRFPSEMVLREWRAQREGPARYRSAGDDAVPRAFQKLHPPVDANSEVNASVELREAPSPLRGLGSAARVRVQVRLDGVLLGELKLPVVAGCVGADRLRDAAAAQFASVLLGMNRRAAARRVQKWLRERSAA